MLLLMAPALNTGHVILGPMRYASPLAEKTLPRESVSRPMEPRSVNLGYRSAVATPTWAV